MTITIGEGARARTSYAQPATGLIGREDTQFAEEIALQERWKAPLTLLTMKLKRGRSRTIDVHWFEDVDLPFTDQINWGTNYNSSATSFTVDNGERFEVGDLVRVYETDEVILITAKSGDIISGTREYGVGEGWTSTAASILDNYYLQIIGNAWEPGAPLPTGRHTLDVEKVNYCQDQRTPVEIAEVPRDTALRGSQDQAWQRKKAAGDHMAKIEYQNFFGKPYAGDKGNYASGTGNTAPATGGGINHYLEYYADSVNKVDQTDLTEFEFMDFLEAAFDKGSSEKLLVCPPSLRWGFDKWGISKQNTFTGTTILGMKISTWQASEGDLRIMTHYGLKAYASSQYNYCFVLDMDNLSWITFGPNGSTKLRPAGNHDTNGYTKESEEYQTISCLMVKLPNTHARLRYKTISV